LGEGREKREKKGEKEKKKGKIQKNVEIFNGK
jgi:hypothetical protein